MDTQPLLNWPVVVDPEETRKFPLLPLEEPLATVVSPLVPATTFEDPKHTVPLPSVELEPLLIETSPPRLDSVPAVNCKPPQRHEPPQIRLAPPAIFTVPLEQVDSPAEMAKSPLAPETLDPEERRILPLLLDSPD
jgi:hypothetical protein